MARQATYPSGCIRDAGGSDTVGFDKRRNPNCSVLANRIAADLVSLDGDSEGLGGYVGGVEPAVAVGTGHNDEVDCLDYSDCSRSPLGEVLRPLAANSGQTSNHALSVRTFNFIDR